MINSQSPINNWSFQDCWGDNSQLNYKEGLNGTRNVYKD